jgi:hypothetical protein
MVAEMSFQELAESFGFCTVPPPLFAHILEGLGARQGLGGGGCTGPAGGGGELLLSMAEFSAS